MITDSSSFWKQRRDGQGHVKDSMGTISDELVPKNVPGARRQSTIFNAVARLNSARSNSRLRRKDTISSKNSK